MTNVIPIKRRDDLDILRAFAIIAVICLHVLSNFSSFIFRNPYNIPLFFFADQFFRFSVPLFVALSGYTLSMRYENQIINLKDFYLRRAWKILPQYFFWSLIILGFYSVVYKSPFNIYSLPTLLGYGKADYHLYFVPMIFQLYLIFPLLIWLWQKIKWKLVIFSFIYELIIYIQVYLKNNSFFGYNAGWNDQTLYMNSSYWIFYFILGISLINLKIKKLIKIGIIFMAIFTFLLAGIYSLKLYKLGFDPIYVNWFLKITVLAYATSFILAGISWTEKLLALPKIIVNTFIGIGKLSYIIFLSHTLVIRMFDKYIRTVWQLKEVNFLILTLLIIFCSVMLAYIYQKIILLLSTIKIKLLERTKA